MNYSGHFTDKDGNKYFPKLQTIYMQGKDLDTLKKTGIYYCDGNCLNLPSDGWSVYLTVISLEGGNYVSQQAITVESARMYIYERQCYGGYWGGWSPIIAQYQIAVNTDFNDVLKTGIYYFEGKVPTGNNRPCNVTGFLEVFTLGGLTTQRYTEYTGAKIYQRGRYLTSWTAWKSIALN